MSRPVARLGDKTTGVCAIHGPIGGEITTSATPGLGDVLTNAPRGTARVGDTVTATCGHTGEIVSGSPKVKTNRRRTARVEDNFQGTYSGTIVSGSPDVNAEP